MDEILRLLPERIRQAVNSKMSNRWNVLQEIRIRLNRRIELVFDEHMEWVEVIKPDRRDSIFVLNQLSEFSLYRMEDELREGYVTIEGGHRVGLAGKVNTLNGAVKAIQYITFFNIRIAKQKIGAAKKLIPYLYKDRYMNTLFVGPPQTGKTTLIRDAARIIGSGWGNIPPQKIGIIDERSEIGGSKKGVPQHDVGIRTDIMDACPKAEGMMMMIRSMSPEILIVDEIGSENDVQALMEAINTGVTVICSIHGNSLEDLKKRPSLQSLFHSNVFKRTVLLSRGTTPGYIQRIYDENGENILQKSGSMHGEMDWSTSFHRRDHIGRI